MARHSHPSDIWPTTPGQPTGPRKGETTPRSWPFLFMDRICWLVSRCFGLLSIIFLTATAASIPIVQFISLGYLLEVSGRVARGGNYSSAFIGVQKASHVGGVLLGTWLLLLPLRFVTLLWNEAILIDPLSLQTQWTRGLQIGLIVLTTAQVSAAWICGGKFRYFFWQLVAPFSFAVWALRKLAHAQPIRPLLSASANWISPHLANDIGNVSPASDWFVPAILLAKIRKGTIYTDARDGLWNFVASLNLKYYLQLGFKGFAGTFIWLLVPTLLLVRATANDDATAVVSAILGVGLAVPVFALLPFLQAHYAKDGQWKSLFQPIQVAKIFWRAPLAHTIALLVTLVLALPLFLLKIEEIPAELLWTLSLVFVTFSWPARTAIGLAYRRGNREGKESRWWISIPIMLMAIPISFAFIFIMFFTRYITWNGAWSLLENHVFLLPAPFWL